MCFKRCFTMCHYVLLCQTIQMDSFRPYCVLPGQIYEAKCTAVPQVLIPDKNSQATKSSPSLTPQDPPTVNAELHKATCSGSSDHDRWAAKMAACLGIK